MSKPQLSTIKQGQTLYFVDPAVEGIKAIFVKDKPVVTEKGVVIEGVLFQDRNVETSVEHDGVGAGFEFANGKHPKGKADVRRLFYSRRKAESYRDLATKCKTIQAIAAA